MIICKKIISVGPEVGTDQEADPRICKAVIGVGPRIGSVDGFGISYGTTGTISYGSSGVILY